MMRLMAVTMGLGILAGVELLLRLQGVSPGVIYTPPRLVHVIENGELTAEFHATSSSKYVRVGDYIQTAPEYARGDGQGFPSSGSMRNARFTPQPAPGVKRYFLLGGSAAVGQNPINPQGRTNWRTVPLNNSVGALAPSLSIAGQIAARLPGTEVINAGMIAQDTSSVLQIALEVLQYGPTGLIIYAGNNDGVGLSYGMRGEEVPVMPEVQSALRGLRLYRLLADRILLARQSAAATETVTLHGTKPDVLGRMTLAYWQSAGQPLLEGNQPIDPVHQALQRRFAENIRQIVHAASAQGVKVYVLPTPPHLRYPPFFEGRDPGLSARAAGRYDRAQSALGHALYQGDQDAALVAINDIIAIDPSVASPHYSLGEILASRGQHAEALEALEAALARDISRKRTLPSYASVAAAVCAETGGCKSYDLHTAMRQEVLSHGMHRYAQLFGDHEHLTPDGCAWVAAHAVALMRE
jgi:tetratricopeptide (TPR) repeat protein